MKALMMVMIREHLNRQDSYPKQDTVLVLIIMLDGTSIRFGVLPLVITPGTGIITTLGGVGIHFGVGMQV